MGHQRRSKRNAIRETYRHILYAINTFDKKPAPPKAGFWSSGWEELRTYDNLREKRIPELIDSLAVRGKITRAQQASFNSMLGSEDRSDWYMVFVILNNQKNKL